MAFKPLQDQHYYLIVKHSQKALGFAKGAVGSSLKQQTFDANNSLQKFFFRRNLNDDTIWIGSAAVNNNYLTIEWGKEESHTPVVLWDLNDKLLFQKLKLLPEKDGYYRIQALHSGKFLDVPGLSTQDGIGVVQDVLSKTDNQLFCMIPVLNNIVGADNTSFSKNTDMVRDIVIGVVSGGLGYFTAGPVGAIAKGGLDYIWEQEDQLADMWNKMKAHMDKRMRALIDDVLTDQLKDIIQGVLKAVKNINDTEEPRGKGDALAVQLQYMANKEPVFSNSKSTKAIPYTIVYGTLAIALKHLMLAEYRRLYFGNPPPSFETLSDKANQLTNSINEYTKAINDFKTKSVNSRLKCIRAEEKPEGVADGVIYSIFTDEYDLWSPAHSGNFPPFLLKDFKNFAIKQRRNYIGIQYAMELDELFNVVNLWKCYIPKKAKDLNATAAAAAKLARDRIEKTFAEMTAMKPSDMLTTLINDVAATIDNTDIKRDITDTGWDVASRAQSKSAEVLKNEFVKSVETVYKNITFAKAYEDGYQEVLALHSAPKSRKEVTLGIFGGDKASHMFAATGKITKIVIHFTDLQFTKILTGLEFFCDGTSSGICGKTGTGKKELKLGENEYISSVSGYMNESIMGICFATQLGNIIDLGNPTFSHATYFIADLPDTLNARLIKISGAHDGTSVQQLSFTWQYEYVDYSELIR